MALNGLPSDQPGGQMGGTRRLAVLLVVLLAALLAAVAKLPRPLDAPGHPPDAKAMAAGSVLGLEVLVGIALPQVFGIDKSLTVFDEGQAPTVRKVVHSV